MAELADIRRLRLRTIATRGSDDLRVFGRHTVSDRVATLAVLRLRRRGIGMLVAGVVCLAGSVAGLAALGSTVDTPGMAAVLAFTLVAPGLLIPSGAVCTVRWSRRARAVRVHGWRPGRASVSSRTYSAVLEVRLADGGTIRISTTLPVNLPFPPLSADRVSLGGDGRWLTVLFLSGPFLMAAKPCPTT